MYLFFTVIGLMIIIMVLRPLLSERPAVDYQDNFNLPPLDTSSDSKEWPLIAESTREQNIYLLKAKLESENIPVIAETNYLNRIYGPLDFLPNQLFVKPEFEKETRQIIKEIGMGKLLI